MKDKQKEITRNILTLLKMDSENLFKRVIERKQEYLLEFSLKRTREHFKDIFYSRYKESTIGELKYIGQEVLVALDQFYSRIEELSWYLNHTQDMMTTVEDKVNFHIKALRKDFDTLKLYINAEIEAEFDLQDTQDFQDEQVLPDEESHDIREDSGELDEIENM